MRSIRSLFSFLAATLVATPSLALDLTQGNTGIAPLGSTFQLQLVLPNSVTNYFGTFTVSENGTALPGCTNISNVHMVDAFSHQDKALVSTSLNDPICRIATSAPGWRQFDIVYTLQSQLAGQYRLQTVDALLPMTLEMPTSALSVLASDGTAKFRIEVIGAQPTAFPGDSAFTPNLSVPVGQLQATLDGTVLTCGKDNTLDTFSGPSRYSAFACSGPTTFGTHALEARFDAVGYATATQSSTVSVQAGAVMTPSAPQALPQGAPVVIGATVVANSGGPLTEGTVAFSENGTAIPGCEAVPVTAGTVSCQVPAPAAGPHPYLLILQSANYRATSATASVYVGPDPLLATATTLDPAFPTGTVHRNDVRVFTATARDVGPATSILSPGFVTFAFDGVDYPPCTRLRNSASVTCARSHLREGRLKVTARFEGDPGYAGSSATQAYPVLHAAMADFDGNYKADILWAHTSGKAALWLMNAAQQIGGGVLFEAGNGWAPKLVGDLDGNEKADLLFTNTDGRVGAWLMDGATQVGGAILVGPGTGWTPTRLADFDGDGKSDILWEHTDGRVAIWLMDGLVQKGGGVVLAAGTGWHPKLTADFNGDGTADILWVHDDGTPAIWLMQGTTILGGGRLFGAGTGWLPKFTADFDGDGKADILWSHPDGRVAVWLMDGATSPAAKVIRAAGSTATPVAVGHILADGRAGIVWRFADGSVARIAMDGTTELVTLASYPAALGATVIRAADFDANGTADLLAQLADGSVVLVTSGAVQTLIPPGTGWSPISFPE